MGASVDASELRILGLDITLSTDEVSPKTAAGFTKIGYDIERSAKIIVPKDTHDLENSISTNVTGGAGQGFVDVEVSATTDYADYVENGTSKMAAQPYMGPSFDRHAPRAADVLLDASLEL
jgi:HK97 gp10 family phage protein